METFYLSNKWDFHFFGFYTKEANPINSSRYFPFPGVETAGSMLMPQRKFKKDINEGRNPLANLYLFDKLLT